MTARGPDKVLAGAGDLELFPRDLGRIGATLGQRFNTDTESLERGLAQLVLTIIELLRQLVERQALRRVEGGTLSDDDVERLGETLMRLAERMEELKDKFGLTDEDLNVHLGPLGDLI